MDYGQNTQTGGDKDFFASGARTNQEDLNNFEAKNNLDLTNNQTDWNSTPAERNNKDLGNMVMESTGIVSNPEITTSPEAPDLEQMGKVVNLEMPPGMEQEENITHAEMAEASLSKIDQKNLKIKENLNKAGIGVVEKTIQLVKSDPAEGFSKFQKDREAALSESFNRVIGGEAV